DDDAMLTAFEGLSPWNEAAVNNANLNLDGWLSTQFVDALNGTTFGVMDPRLPRIGTITQFGDYRGTPNGEGRIGSGTDEEESYLSLDGFYSSAGAPLLMITNAETEFIRAEASFRNDDLPGAYAAYIAGITANMTKLGVAESDMDAYLANPAVGVGASNITLDLIFKEKYVVMFLNPEAWVDAKRFDYKYKDFELPTGASLDDFIRRLAYPTVETSRNGANVPEVNNLKEKLRFDQ
ncbi:MAG TPA: SusD/RagB family nutrient-binding outer membrane lipoprotein, partial [Chryseolinea sp.]|nr:SusD/RagB family nutrient-binding outer membrane lipoprotein [Chryseolinea sp.]